MNNFLNQIYNLHGKVVVITGAGGYLCGEMARGFAKVGCHVALLDMRIEKAKEVESKINHEGFYNTCCFKLNVIKKKNYLKVFQDIIKKFGKVDILVNGAGINSPTPFLKITEQEWDDVLAVQLKGTLFGCQIFGDHMLKNKSGSIINISSASAGPPLSKAFAYSVAKSGTKNLTQNLAREWAEKGVRVNALRPGFFPTEWNRKNFINEKRKKMILGHTPMRRFGKPKELIGAVLWLSSDAASFVTGAEITVDGGFSAMTI